MTISRSDSFRERFFMNISFTEDLFSFNRYEMAHMIKPTLISSVPFMPIVPSIFEMAVQLNPQICRDDVDDEEGEIFVVSDAPKEEREKIAQILLDRTVEVVSSSAERAASIKENLKNQILTAWEQRLIKISDIAKDFGVERLDFGIYLNSEDYSPCQVIGSRSSYFSDPMLLVTPHQKVRIHDEPGARLPSENIADSQEKLLKMKDFILVHEMSHIAHNHTLIRTIAKVALSILTAGLWIAGLQGAFSFGLCIVTVLSSCFLFQLFMNTLCRYQERSADIEALNYLGTNEGGLEFIKCYKDIANPHDLEHPSMERRYDYISKWEEQRV